MSLCACCGSLLSCRLAGFPQCLLPSRCVPSVTQTGLPTLGCVPGFSFHRGVLQVSQCGPVGPLRIHPCSGMTRGSPSDLEVAACTYLHEGSFYWTSRAVGPRPLSTQGVSFSEAHPPAPTFHYAYLKPLLYSVLLWCPGPREREMLFLSPQHCFQ